MCGIAGFFNPSNITGKSAVHNTLTAMGDALHHRGPDDSGIWSDSSTGIAFTHRRLSVIDLSHAGHQPMISHSDRYVIIFNGEVYNHLQLRQELDKNNLINWSGQSDTETLLACIDFWGLKQALKKTVGMFAFALWDKKRKQLFLVMDRMGEKPLYYGWQNGVFLFGSELKALKRHSAFEAVIDRNQISQIMRFSYIPAPNSIYKNIRKLLPGTIFSLAYGPGIDTSTLPEPEAYWSLSQTASTGQNKIFSGSDDEAIHQLEALLNDAVGMQMAADVPLGVFLSGGIDSSIVAALMQSLSKRPVETFSIGFEEQNYNEAKYAKQVSCHLGTEHTELYISSAEAIETIPRLPSLYDEPFADSSQIPTYLVSAMTRRHVTVALTGDGGDELFGGYNRHIWGNRICSRIGNLPIPFLQLLGNGITRISPQTLDAVLNGVTRILPSRLQTTHWGDKLHKLAEIISVDSPDDLYRRLISHWHNPHEIVLNTDNLQECAHLPADIAAAMDFSQRIMYLDTIGYLPGDILTKIDRAAMGVSLETRMPLLDHRVVEFAWQLPLTMKIRDGKGKWILRQILNHYVPENLIDRPKMGFGVPIDKWLRGSLREWAETLLDESRLKVEGFFHAQPIRDKWEEHLSGKRNWSHHLWNVLMFQAWLEVNKT